MMLKSSDVELLTYFTVGNTENSPSQLAGNTNEVASSGDSTDDRLIPLAKTFPINDKFKSGTLIDVPIVFVR